MFIKIFLLVALAELCLAGHHKLETPDLRIINGQTVDPNSIPWAVHIELDNPKHQDSCGGSLISAKHVLTAAHCFKGNMKAKYVLVGAHNITNTNESTQQKLQVEKYDLHPQYNKPKYSNDIAIIKLKTAANVDNKIVKLATLAPASEASAPYKDKFVKVYGWGWVDDKPVRETDVLQGASLMVLPNADCLKKAPNKDVFPGDMCTSSVQTRNICEGDSGGPVMLKNVQIAVISRSVSGGSCKGSFPAVHTRVGYYRDWINKTIK